MKAVVTGGAGSLGSSLTKLLTDKGWNVHVYDVLQVNRAWRLKDIMDQVTYHWKSIHDVNKRDFEGLDLVAHCAAQPDRPLGLTSPLYTMDLNVMGLTRVLEACKDSGIQKFLFPGSGTTFTGVPEDELPVTEDTVPRPTNPYSASKYAAEILCHTYRKCYQVPTVTLRSGIVYGAGMRLDISIAQFIIKALRNQTVNVRSPYATRTPTHIDDVLLYWDAIIEAEPERVVGGTFHSVFGKEYTILDIANTVVNVVGSVEVVPSEYEKGELVNGKPVREWTTSTKDEYLGVHPKIDLSEGIEKTVPYIKEAMEK